MPQLVVSWIVTGALAGLAVFLFSTRRVRGGLFGNLMVGVIGALLGGYFVTAATHADVAQTTLTWGILVVSIVSALVLGIVVQSQSSPRAQAEKPRKK